MEKIKDIIMRRDGLTLDEADSLIQDAVDALDESEMGIEEVEDVLKDYFGLEPDYLFQLIELWEARNAK